jgi:hypothetical protein
MSLRFCCRISLRFVGLSLRFYCYEVLCFGLVDVGVLLTCVFRRGRGLFL